MTNMSLGPFDLTGGPFLFLYGTLFLAALVTSTVFGRRMRAQGRAQEVSDPDLLAWLARGRTGFVDAVVTRLLVRGDLVLIGREKFGAKPGARGTTAAESAALAMATPSGWDVVHRSVGGYAEMIERKLIDAGLVVDRKSLDDTRFWQALPLVLLAGFGAIKVMIGEARDRPVGFLLLFIAMTLVVAAVRWFHVDRRTQAAHDALAAARTRHERLKRAPTAPEMSLGVALFGTGILMGSAYADFHRMRGADGGGDGGGADGGSSGDGGGGCGGGCGGCGS
jgi:uncharacterized protein (TIGR04222 family)